jgi:hypothetical protein
VYFAPLKALKSIFHCIALVRILAIFKLMSTFDSRIFLNSVCYVNFMIRMLSFLWSSNLELSISMLTWGVLSIWVTSVLIFKKPL